MSQTRRVSTEQGLYALALLLALVLRLWRLGAAPLGEGEARLALNALGVAGRHVQALGAAPLLTALSGLAFFALGSTNAIARLVPALVGSFLPALAWPLRRAVGRPNALVLAFALALDPALVALSRRADSPVLAVAALAALLIAVYRQRWAWAFPLLALGALSGPTFWWGGLALLLGLALWRVRGGRLRLKVDLPAVKRGAWIALGLWVLGASLAFWTPEGVGSLLNSLVALVRMFFHRQGASPWLLGVALAAYAPLASAAAAVAAGIACFRQRRLPWWGWVILATMLLWVLTPSRGVALLAWLMPLLWLAAAEALTALPRRHLRDAAWQAAVLLSMLGFSGLNLAAWSQRNGQQASLALLLSVGTWGLALILAALMATSWRGYGRRWGEALGGLTWGLSAVGGLLTVAALFHAAYGPRSAEIWYPQATATPTVLLQTTLEDMAQWYTGRPDALEVVDLTRTAPVAWMLRNMPAARSQLALGPAQRPQVVVAFETWQPQNLGGYRGQDFLFRRTSVWPFASTKHAVQWLFFRRPLPLPQTRLVLWVQADLFPQPKKRP